MLERLLAKLGYFKRRPAHQWPHREEPTHPSTGGFAPAANNFRPYGPPAAPLHLEYPRQRQGSVLEAWTQEDQDTWLHNRSRVIVDDTQTRDDLVTDVSIYVGDDTEPDFFAQMPVLPKS